MHTRPRQQASRICVRPDDGDVSVVYGVERSGIGLTCHPSRTASRQAASLRILLPRSMRAIHRCVEGEKPFSRGRRGVLGGCGPRRVVVRVAQRRASLFRHERDAVAPAFAAVVPVRPLRRRVRPATSDRDTLSALVLEMAAPSHRPPAGRRPLEAGRARRPRRHRTHRYRRVRARVPYEQDPHDHGVSEPACEVRESL